MNRPLPVSDVKITDRFWKAEMELVRTEMLPYQYEALNDRVPDAAPSFCVHNFRAAARLQARRRAGKDWTFPVWKGTFETLPGDSVSDSAFYGFVFQDSDLYKWLEAVSYSLMNHPDPDLEATAADMADLICAAQEEDGYLDTFYILHNRVGAFSNLKDHHELYCLGHLTEAAVAWHQATGRDNLLKAAERFADCVARVIGPEDGLEKGYPGHEIAEMALLRLYEETGEERFLKQSRYFLNQRGQTPNYFVAETSRARVKEGGKPLPESEAAGMKYYQAHTPVRKQDEAVGHAVRAMYLYSGMADLARLDGDEDMARACERLFRSTVREKMYVTGGVGGTHVGEAFSRPFDLPGDTAYSETCAAVGLVFFMRRMLQMRPSSVYADVMERALNTVLSGMAMDGKSFFYVNPLEVDPEACETDARLSHVKPVRQKWFGCACCPPNVARLLSSLSQYALTASDDSVYVHLPMELEARMQLSGTPVTLRTEGGWREGRLRVTLETDAGEARGRIAVRVPGWCEKPSCTCTAGEGVMEDGYFTVDAAWKNGDSLEILMPPTARVLQADLRVKEVLGRVCVQYGPLVMCAEEADNGKHLERLRLDTACPDFMTGMEEICGISVPVLTCRGYRLLPEEEKDLYTPFRTRREEEVRIRLVPYFAWGNRGKGEMRVWLRA